MTTKDILSEMSLVFNWSKNTYNSYYYAVKSYEQCHDMSLQQLLDEADQEEEQQIRLKNRKIKQRILTYIQQYNQKWTPSTLNKRVILLKSVYKYQDIEFPRINYKYGSTEENIEDIPSKKHIKQAIESTNNINIKALICFMASSGCGSAEARNITIQQFMEATKEYHNEVTIPSWIQRLKQTENVIPTIHIIRQKTKTDYYVFCTPEATSFILQMLEQRLYKEELHKTDLLFPYVPDTVTKIFARINNRNNWGKKGNQCFFHSHAMRKFFATTLTKNRVDFLITEFLLGHKINKTTAAYYKLDPGMLKHEYLMLLSELSFFEEIHYHDLESKEKQELNQLSQRLEKIERLLLQRKK